MSWRGSTTGHRIGRNAQSAVPKGDVRDLAKLRSVNEHGRKMFARQSYTFVSAVAQGDRVVLETVWSAVLRVPLGRLEAGREMRARSAQIFQLRDGLIRRHRSYDSFDW